MTTDTQLQRAAAELVDSWRSQASGMIEGQVSEVLLSCADELVEALTRQSGEPGLGHPALVSLIARFLFERDDSIGDDEKTDYERQESARVILREVGEFYTAPQPAVTEDEEGDMFWLAEDGERFGHSVEELIDDADDGAEIEVQTAIRLPNFWIRVIHDDEGSRYELLAAKPEVQG